MQTVAGLATARGFAVGPVFLYRGGGDIPVSEYVVEPGCEGDEMRRLKRALNETRRDLEGLIAALRERTGHDDVSIFECHLMILEDAMFLEEVEKYIVEDRLNAEASVRKTINNTRQQFARMNDSYFRERVRDLDDVERRLLKAITGFGGSSQLELKSPSIIVADDLTPSETVQLPRELVLGFATNGGSTTSHVALLARAMGIPAVTGLGDITSQVSAGETVLLDGTRGEITLHPDLLAIRDFSDLVERQKEIAEDAVFGVPAGTLRDGGGVIICANVHPGVPLEDVRSHGARGIGLYRSEYLWLNREREPDEEEQFSAYREAAEFMTSIGPDAVLTIRTLDIGGDKLVRGISEKEDNPFLGNRSIRYLLSHRDVFRTQLRAILRASAFGKVALMYPMVSCVDELQASAEVLAEVKRQLEAEGVDYDRDIKVGVMIEVPAAAVNSDALAKYVDFFSVGTNDLVQYSMAADRGNDAVAHLYQPTNPAVIKLMRMTLDAAKANGIKVSVCGESASDPIIGMLWIAMGVDELSMSATYIPQIAKLCQRLSRADLDEFLSVVRGLGYGATSKEIYDKCNEWMRARIPDLDNIVI